MLKRGLLLLILIACSGIVCAQSVTRSFNSSQVYPDDPITVTLTVTVGSADAYAIDETIPTGWSVTDPGSASTLHTGHLKWVVIGEDSNSEYDCTDLDSCVGSLSDTTYTYVLQAPSSTGSTTIAGIYMFDVGQQTTIGGANSITVVDRPATACSDHISRTDCEADTANSCDWCALASTNQCRAATEVECETLGCIDNANECRDTCKIASCGTGYFCNQTSDVCEVVPENTTVDTSCTGNGYYCCSSGNTCSNTRGGDGCGTGTCCASSSDCTTGGGNGGNGGTTCVSSWSCTDWTPATCPADTKRQSRTCNDLNTCATPTDKPTQERSCRAIGTGGSGGTDTSGTDTSRGRTTGGSTDRTDTTSTSRSGSRSTGTTTNETKTPATVLEENAETADYLFYVLLIIVLIMAIGIGYYFYSKKGGGIKFNQMTAPPRRVPGQPGMGPPGGQPGQGQPGQGPGQAAPANFGQPPNQWRPM